MLEQINRWQEEGYDSRKDYLQHLAIDYGIDIDVVQDLANDLGEEEDFNELLKELEAILAED